MPYCLSTSLALSFEEALHRTASVLKNAGLDVIQDLDVQAVLRERMDLEFHPFHILTTLAKSPASTPMQLPFNVMVRKPGQGAVEIAFIPPATTGEMEEDPQLRARAGELALRLHQAVSDLASATSALPRQ